jgi:hypothetical protein
MLSHPLDHCDGVCLHLSRLILLVSFMLQLGGLLVFKPLFVPHMSLFNACTNLYFVARCDNSGIELACLQYLRRLPFHQCCSTCRIESYFQVTRFCMDSRWWIPPRRKCTVRPGASCSEECSIGTDFFYLRSILLLTLLCMTGRTDRLCVNGLSPWRVRILGL